MIVYKKKQLLHGFSQIQQQIDNNIQSSILEKSKKILVRCEDLEICFHLWYFHIDNLNDLNLPIKINWRRSNT